MGISDDALDDVRDERGRQIQKWGIQSLPDGTGVPREWREYKRKFYQERCERHAKEGRVSWMDVLAEEVAEAFAEVNPCCLREELVQVAAVCVAWIEDIDRRSKDANR
jgi:hypothetical protein